MVGQTTQLGQENLQGTRRVFSDEVKTQEGVNRGVVEGRGVRPDDREPPCPNLSVEVFLEEVGDERVEQESLFTSPGTASTWREAVVDGYERAGDVLVGDRFDDDPGERLGPPSNRNRVGRSTGWSPTATTAIKSGRYQWS